MFVRLKGPRVFGIAGNANLRKEYLAADIAGRVIYTIGGLLGNLWPYNIDARTFDNLAPSRAARSGTPPIATNVPGVNATGRMIHL